MWQEILHRVQWQVGFSNQPHMPCMRIYVLTRHIVTAALCKAK